MPPRRSFWKHFFVCPLRCPTCRSTRLRTPASPRNISARVTNAIVFCLGAVLTVILDGAPMIEWLWRPLDRACLRCGLRFREERPDSSHTVNCPQCDYNLTGNTSNRCPECGWAISTEVRDAIDS